MPKKPINHAINLSALRKYYIKSLLRQSEKNNNQGAILYYKVVKDFIN